MIFLFFFNNQYISDFKITMDCISFHNQRFHYKEILGVFAKVDSETGFIKINEFIEPDLSYSGYEYIKYIRRTNKAFENWVTDNYYNYLQSYEGFGKMEFEGINTNDSSIWDQFSKNRTNLYYHSVGNSCGGLNCPIFDGWYVNPSILRIVVKNINPNIIYNEF